MISTDRVYQTVQALLNKAQLGYLKPFYYNLFVNKATTSITSDFLTDLKSAIRKSNWHLDGSELSNMSELKKQLVEYYTIEYDYTPSVDVPLDLEYVIDVFYNGSEVSKVSYKKFNLLKKNVYALPSECTPICYLSSRILKVLPSTISTLNLFYIRKHKQSKWTFEPFNGRPMFNPSKLDFKNIDLPSMFESLLIDITTEYSSIYLRELKLADFENREQAIDFKNKEKQ